MSAKQFARLSAMAATLALLLTARLFLRLAKWVVDGSLPADKRGSFDAFLIFLLERQLERHAKQQQP